MHQASSYTINLLLLLVQTDGSLYLASPVDPLFLLLPILDRARMKVSIVLLSDGELPPVILPVFHVFVVIFPESGRW